MLQIKRTITESDASGILAAPQFIAQLQAVERFNPVRMPALDSGGNIKLLPEGSDELTRSFTVDPTVS